jgi:hypothetical protein
MQNDLLIFIVIAVAVGAILIVLLNAGGLL